MATRDKRRYQRDPSETQLRVMLEARQHELDAHRQRTSRTFSMILVGVVFLVSGAIWLFPAAPEASADSVQAAASPATAVADSARDIRFSLQLLDFVSPSATAAATTGTGNPTAPVAETTTKASVAMP